jgi:hypothetical protein
MFDEDPDDFLDTDEHAVDAIYDGATKVKVIIDRAYLEGVGIGGTNPVATGKASDFPATAIGKTLAEDPEHPWPAWIGATSFTIRGREPQDDGAFVLLQLEAP